MNNTKFLQKLVEAVLLIVYLAGCGAPTATPTLPPMFPPPPPPPPTFPPPPTLTKPELPTGQPELFKFIQTVQITPDANFLGGGFARINYVPATDRFVVTFSATLAEPSGECKIGGYAYKEYTLDMQKTGKTGIYSCEYGDSGSVMVDNTYYFITPEFKPYGWHLVKFDAITWETLAETHMYLEHQEDSGKYPNNDPMVAYVNGQLDISSQYQPSGMPPDLMAGVATYHDFFSTDLQLLGHKILTDTPHIGGSSMIYADGFYYLVTANAFLGDMVVITYDQNWNYLGVKTLKHTAHWSTGLAYDGQRFYVAYLDNSQTLTGRSLPVYLNVRLAAFDRDWNLMDDIAVTNYAIADNMQTGRPWVIIHGNRLYVSYDLDKMDPVLRTEEKKGQAIVSVYELTQMP
jgi:hypothetical protein